MVNDRTSGPRVIAREGRFRDPKEVGCFVAARLNDGAARSVRR
jgi:hypothetical protein